MSLELDEHLGYEPPAPEGRGSGNSRNGSYPKTVIADVGPDEVQMPRDQNATFEPDTVTKPARRSAHRAGRVLAVREGPDDR